MRRSAEPIGQKAEGAGVRAKPAEMKASTAWDMRLMVRDEMNAEFDKG